MADASLTSPPAGKSFWRGLAWRLLRGVLLIYLGVLLMMLWLEESLLFFPTRYPDGNWTSPGVPVEDAEFTAADGVKLHGWYLPTARPKAFVLLAHGNGGNLSHRLDLLHTLHGAGAAVLIFDYRGYGKSEIAPINETGILADARAARHWLAERAGAPENQLVLMGESLGGGVAVDLAAKDGARGLILLNTFSSLPEVAAWHYPIFPVRLMMINRLDSLGKIANYHGPLLQIHGDADQIVPLASAEKLFAAANEPKSLVRIPGGDHNDGLGPKSADAIVKFVSELPAPQ